MKSFSGTPNSSAQEQVRQAVEQELKPRIVDHASAANKAGAENGVPTLAQDLPVANHIAAVIGFIGHHDNDGVAG